MSSCPYVPPVFLAPFTRPLMRALAYYFPDRSLREARPGPQGSPPDPSPSSLREARPASWGSRP